MEIKGERKNLQKQFNAIPHANPAEDALEVSPDGRHAESRGLSDLLIAHGAEQSLDDANLLRRKLQRGGNCGPCFGIEG